MMDPSSSREIVGDHEDIFLSHSCEQKDFVEHLCEALKGANLSAFFHKSSFEQVSQFPSQIESAVRSCKLGVVVLSHDFFTSKLPMLELLEMNSHGIRMLPLFYKLSVEDLKSEKMSDWRCRWNKLLDEQQAEQCEIAVKKLRSINGEVYKGREGEVAYIKKVVTVICKLIPSNAKYNLSSIQGHQELVKEIKGHFDKLVAHASHGKKACLVGLYGGGGLGKTTLCKSMVNVFTSEYSGRSCLIEFPTDCDNEKVVEQCKMALKKLANLGDKVSKINSFDEVVEQMDYVTHFDVFLAIDNVWEDCLEEAERLLGIGFTDSSKVLLTCRSEELLWELLSHDTNNSYYYHIDSLPAPNQENALQIFQQSVNRGDLTSLPVRPEIENVLERCRYDGKYNPQALKALGSQVKRLCGRGHSEMNRHDWLRILGEIDYTALLPVDNSMKPN